MKTLKPRVLEDMIKQIPAYLEISRVDISQWNTMNGIHSAPGEFTSIQGEGETISLGDRWTAGYDFTRWFSAKVSVPESMNGKKVYLLIDFGGEALVRINGEIVGAVSSKMNSGWVHRDSIFLDKPKAGDVFEIEIEATVNSGGFCDAAMDGLEFETYKLEKACLYCVDEAAESYWFDITMAFDALSQISDEVIKSRLYNAVDNSLHMLDFDMGNKAFQKSVPDAINILWEAVNKIPGSAPGEVIMVGHSHLDVAWLWTVREIVRKTARTFANNLALMDRYDDFRFSQSQAVLYDFVKRYYPELYERVKDKIKSGAWEVTGNAWVEADTNIANGESLIRQLLYGRKFFMEEFGISSETYWLPDCFGFSWALPQIISRSGMKNFITAKIMGNDTNPFPHSVFRWRAHSGDEVVAYIQKPGYQGGYTAGNVAVPWKENRQNDVVNCSMGMFGYGDGGGGCTYGMVENGRRLSKIPGLPKSRQGSSAEFFEKVSAEKESLPVWDGELYYENHRGTYTSQAFVKKYNRKGEILLRNAEMLSVIAQDFSSLKVQAKKLEETWKLLLINQFHDILPGSSIHEVYVDSRKEYEEMENNGNFILEGARDALNNLIGIESDSIIVWNLLSWRVAAPVCAEIPFDIADVTDKNGIIIPSKISKNNGKNYIEFIASDVSPLGYSVFNLVDQKSRQGCVVAEPGLLENNLLRVELDENGLLTSVFDKINNREVLSGKGNLLSVFQDKPIHESAWNIEINYQKKYWDLIEADSIEVVEASPVKGVIKITRSFNKSKISQSIILYQGAGYLDFETEIDLYETEKTFKAAFPVNIRSTFASYEIAHGAINRPTHSNTTHDLAQFEVSAHKWADLSEGGYGVSLINDCKYGYDIKDNVMRLTLMRSPNCPDRTADQGKNSFLYRLYPHADSWQNGKTVQAGFEANVPLSAKYATSKSGSLPTEFSFVEIDKGNIILDALKPAEDGNGFIVRVYEAEGRRSEVNTKLQLCFNSVTECNLMEVDERSLSCHNRSFKFSIKPHEVKTFRLK